MENVRVGHVADKLLDQRPGPLYTLIAVTHRPILRRAPSTLTARSRHWRQTPRKVLKTEQPDGASQQFYPTRAVDDGDIGKRGRSRFTSGNANSDEPDANDA